MNIAIQPIPDGVYTAKIETLSMKKTKKGDPMLEWHCVVHGGEHAGVTFVKRSVLSTPKAKAFTVGEFQKLGIHIRNSGDLRNQRSNIEGMLPKFAIVTDENGSVAYYVVALEKCTPEQTTDDDGGDAWNKDW